MTINIENFLSFLITVVIVFASLYFVLVRVDKVTLHNSVVYDGCYEIYAQNEMPSEAFIPFMKDCMSNK